MKRSPKPWNPPAWLERAFIYIAFVVAVVASVALLLWILVTFVPPFSIYSRETQPVTLKNGQVLRVKYPNLVLAEDSPAYITLILSGESNAKDLATFTVDIPPGLAVVKPAEQAQTEKVKLTAPDLGSTTKPSQLRVGLINSRSVHGIWLFARKSIKITSSSMQHSQSIPIGVETTLWTSFRGIVNNTINEKSALILLVTGFLSGAGTLVLQYIKTQQDRAREDRQKKEERFYNLMQSDYEGAISVFLRNESRTQLESYDDFVIYKTLVEQSNWYDKLSVNIREHLKKREFAEASRVAKILKEVCDLLSGLKEDEKTGLQSLCELCKLASIPDRQNETLSGEDAVSLKTAYRRWDDLGSIITDLIQDFSFLPGNLFLLYDVLQKDEDGVGRKLLENSNLQYVIRGWRTENLSQADVEMLRTIKAETAYSIRWRPLWDDREQKLSEKVQRWLSGLWYE
jgi:hypothetical protein